MKWIHLLCRGCTPEIWTGIQESCGLYMNMYSIRENAKLVNRLFFQNHPARLGSVDYIQTFLTHT